MRRHRKSVSNGCPIALLISESAVVGRVGPNKRCIGVLRRARIDERRQSVIVDDQRFGGMGFELIPGTPDEFDRMLRADYEAFGAVVRKFGIRAE